MDLPTLNRDDEDGEGGSPGPRGAGLLWWLEDPYECDECGAYCEATREYVAAQALPDVPVWSCPDCDARYYRDDAAARAAEDGTGPGL